MVCFSRRSQGHDSSESEGEDLVPPPKRQKVQVVYKSNYFYLTIFPLRFTLVNVCLLCC